MPLPQMRSSGILLLDICGWKPHLQVLCQPLKAFWRRAREKNRRPQPVKRVRWDAGIESGGVKKLREERERAAGSPSRPLLFYLSLDRLGSPEKRRSYSAGQQRAGPSGLFL